MRPDEIREDIVDLRKLHWHDNIEPFAENVRGGNGHTSIRLLEERGGWTAGEGIRKC